MTGPELPTLPPTGDRTLYREYVDGNGHGPVFMTRGLLSGAVTIRAWCVACAQWVGPDRTGNTRALLLVKRDALTHLHTAGRP